MGCRLSYDKYNGPQQFICEHHFGPEGQNVCKDSRHCCIACPYKALNANDLNTHYGARSNLQCCIARNKETLIMNRIDTANASGMRVNRTTNDNSVVHTQPYCPFVSNNEYNDNIARYGKESLLDIGENQKATSMESEKNDDLSSQVNHDEQFNNKDDNCDVQVESRSLLSFRVCKE